MSTMTETRTYEELERVAVPEDVPELGVRAGRMGTVATVYDGGRMLDVEIAREDGTSAGFVDLRVEDGGDLRVVGYSLLDARRAD